MPQTAIQNNVQAAAAQPAQQLMDTCEDIDVEDIDEKEVG